MFFALQMSHRRPKSPAIQMHDAGVEGVRVEVVIKQIFADGALPVGVHGAEQECPTLMIAAPTRTQVHHQAVPLRRRAGNLMPRRKKAIDNRSN